MRQDPRQPEEGFNLPPENRPADPEVVLIIAAGIGAMVLIIAMAAVHIAFGPVQ